MSAERLKALVEQGNLINLNIVSDSLGTLLNEIAQMLVDQQRQLNTIKKDINDKLNTKEFTQFTNQWRTDRDMILRSFPNFEASIAKLSKETEHKFDEVKQNVENSIDSVLMSTDTRINEKIGTLESDTLLLQHRIESFEQKYKNITQQVTKADVDAIKKRLLKVESDLTVVTAPKINQQMLDQLKEEMEKKLEDIQVNMVPVDSKELKTGNSATSSTILPPSTSTTTKLEPVSDLGGIPRFGVPGGEILDTIEPIEENEAPIDDIAELKKNIESLEAKIEEQSKNLITKNSWRSEVTLVERMFEKTRQFITQLKDEVDAAVKKSDQCVKKKDLDEYVENKVNSFLETKDVIMNGPPLRCVNYKQDSKTPAAKRSIDTAPINGPLPVLLLKHRQKE